MNQVRFRRAGLSRLINQALTPRKVQVGVLSDEPRRDGKDNAAIGLEHEFGNYSERLPQRSFLLMPLEKHMRLDELSASEWFKLFMDKNPRPMLHALGDLAEDTIQTAFDTGGFGEWPGLSPRTIAGKGHDTILVDTTDLRGSIEHRIA